MYIILLSSLATFVPPPPPPHPADDAAFSWGSGTFAVYCVPRSS